MSKFKTAEPLSLLEIYLCSGNLKNNFHTAHKGLLMSNTLKYLPLPPNQWSYKSILSLKKKINSPP